MRLHAKSVAALICMILMLRYQAMSAATTYGGSPALEEASAALPGERVRISFDRYETYTLFHQSVIISNIGFSGDVLLVQNVPGLPFQYLNNYDSGVPLTLRFPTGARAFGAYFSSWLSPSYPRSIVMTATTDSGDVFTFDAFTSDAQTSPVNLSYFGLIPAALMYQVTLSDGGLFQSGGYSTHQELIAELFAVLNKPPILDLVSSGPSQLNLGVNGAAGQTVVLLSSTNLANWQPVITNKLAGDRWVYAIAQTNSATARYYRVGAM